MNREIIDLEDLVQPDVSKDEFLLKIRTHLNWPRMCGRTFSLTPWQSVHKMGAFCGKGKNCPKEGKTALKDGLILNEWMCETPIFEKIEKRMYNLVLKGLMVLSDSPINITV